MRDRKGRMPEYAGREVGKIEEAIGRNIDRLRGDMSQAELGRRLEPYVGEWSRQAVSAAIKGRRSFTAAELVALAMALGTTIPELMHSTDYVELRDGDQVAPNELESVLYQTGRKTHAIAKEQMREAADLIRRTADAQRGLDHLIPLLRVYLDEYPDFRDEIEHSRDDVLRKMRISDTERMWNSPWIQVCDELLGERSEIDG